MRRKRHKNKFVEFSLTNWLIAINVVAFVMFTILLIGDLNLETALIYTALKPSLFIEGFVWTLLTSMFMHGSFAHLLVNMFSLFFIGNLVERIIGRKRYFWIYLISGIVAGLAFVTFAYIGLFIPAGERIFGGIDTFAVGASGALFGLGGLLAVLIPKLRVLIFFFIPMPMWVAMLVLMFGLWILSAVGGLPIGNTAHFGGLVVGIIYGFYLRYKYSRKVKMLNRMFI